MSQLDKHQATLYSQPDMHNLHLRTTGRHLGRLVKRWFPVLLIITFDMILMVLFTKTTQQTLYTVPVVKHIKLHIAIFLPLAIVLDSLNIFPDLNRMSRFALFGFISGLITPPFLLLDTWLPAILTNIGIHHSSAWKLALEDFNESFVRCLLAIIPTAIFGAIAWTLIYLLNTVAINAYHATITPTAKSFVSWFKDVFRK